MELKKFFENQKDDEIIKYTDVDRKIMQIMETALRQALKECRDIDYEKFEAYCFEYWNMLPRCTVERCLIKINENKDFLTTN